jgi:hypothetical protein
MHPVIPINSQLAFGGAYTVVSSALHSCVVPATQLGSSGYTIVLFVDFSYKFSFSLFFFTTPPFTPLFRKTTI